MEEMVEFSYDESSLWSRWVEEEEEEWGRWEKIVRSDI